MFSLREKLWYLIKEGVVTPLDPCPVGLSTHVDLHHGFDVIPRQLTGLDDPNTDLKDKQYHGILSYSDQKYLGPKT